MLQKRQESCWKTYLRYGNQLTEMESGRLVLTILDPVYVDTVEDKSIVALRPKSAFRPIFDIATTREDSGIALIHESVPGAKNSEPNGPCSWWRRGRVELHGEHGLPLLVAA
jgi:hypothetical protein